jgi:two-component system response regulator AtoC
MSHVERLVGKVAPTDCTVLIVGESGTGKSVLARMLHEQSGRRDALFLSVNCAAIPDQLLESEFFGHTKGAFTNAHRTRKGLFLEADRGTLFLDEIDEVPLQMQTKLLHAIEDKEIRPVGGEQPRRVDTRIIVASNRDLPELVGAGKFREDLFFRLSMFRIVMPPLRDRPEDVRGLIQFFLHVNNAMKRSSPATKLDPEAEEILLRYSWPGNVRELENVINRACLLAEGGRISVGDLPAELVDAVSPPVPAQSAIEADQSLRDHLRRLEADFVRKAITDAGDDRKLAAQRLGISLSTLYSKLAELEHK